MNAIILINKPKDFRSTKCVAIARKKLNGLKTGHAGTLDSSASGLLVLLSGNATRLCEYVMSLPKVYRTVIQFGAETDTDDYTGNVISQKGYADFDGSIITKLLLRFSGLRPQMPPSVSAIKINGQPAHKLARSGLDVNLKERPVFFRHINIITPYCQNNGTLELEVHCGRGTYIRSLARDLGRLSGTGAYVKSLERISTGLFTLNDAAHPDDEIKPLPLSRLAENFTGIYIDGRDAKSFANGMSIQLSHALRTQRGFYTGADKSLCVESDTFLGFGTYAGYEYLKPDVIVPKDMLYSSSC